MITKFDYDFFEEIEIELTGTCNLKCCRCTRNYLHAQHLMKPNTRKLNEITDQLNKFKNLKCIMLAGQISEPTLYPDFINLIKYLKERNIKIDLFTNASILKIKLFENLKNILGMNDRLIFTICGSTQELHEKYRVGSKLDNILENAKAFINQNRNDYLQYIRFTYNSKDLNEFKNNRGKFDIFNNFFIVDSEGDRLFNDTITPRDCIPCNEVFNKKIFSKLNELKTFKPVCRSLLSRKIYIDQFGKIFPCYSFAEYNNIDFDLNDIYNKINSGKIDSCKICSKSCNTLMKLYGIDFVC